MNYDVISIRVNFSPLHCSKFWDFFGESPNTPNNPRVRIPFLLQFVQGRPILAPLFTGLSLTLSRARALAHAHRDRDGDAEEKNRRRRNRPHTREQE